MPLRTAAALVAVVAITACKPSEHDHAAHTSAASVTLDAGTVEAPWERKSKPYTPTPIPGPPIELTEDVRKRWRRSEYDRTAAEPLAIHIPETSTGAASPEALARAYAEALSKKDRDAIAQLVLSRADMPTVFGDATTEKFRRGISIEPASTFLGYDEAPGPRTITTGRFTPGQEYRVHKGIRLEGVLFLTDVTLLDRSLLDVTIDGVPQRLEFMMMMRVGDRWKLFERVFVRPAAP